MQGYNSDPNLGLGAKKDSSNPNRGLTLIESQRCFRLKKAMEHAEITRSGVVDNDGLQGPRLVVCLRPRKASLVAQEIREKVASPSHMVAKKILKSA